MRHSTIRGMALRRLRKMSDADLLLEHESAKRGYPFDMIATEIYRAAEQVMRERNLNDESKSRGNDEQQNDMRGKRFKET